LETHAGEEDQEETSYGGKKVYVANRGKEKGKYLGWGCYLNILFEFRESTSLKTSRVRVQKVRRRRVLVEKCHGETAISLPKGGRQFQSEGLGKEKLTKKAKGNSA